MNLALVSRFEGGAAAQIGAKGLRHATEPAAYASVVTRDQTRTGVVSGPL